jgi:hypothetical protein
VLLVVPALAACSAPDQTPRTITVLGTGLATGQPDVAVVTFGMWNKDEDADKAVADSKKKLVEVLVALNGLGIDQNDIQPFNVSMTSEAIFGADNFPTDRLLYGVNQMVNVTVRDQSQIGAILNTLRGLIGAPYIFSLGVNYSLSDERLDQLTAQAHDQALAEAQANATRLAQALGAALDIPISVVVTGNQLVPGATSQIQVSLEVTYRLK